MVDYPISPHSTNPQPHPLHAGYPYNISFLHSYRSVDLYISGTKNGSDCYCTNHTGLQSYYDHGSALYYPLNVTNLVPYLVNVSYPCNKTEPIWTSQTLMGDCRDRDWLATCLEDCQMDVRSSCVADFEVICTDLAVSRCALSSNASTNGNSSWIVGGNMTATPTPTPTPTPTGGNATVGNTTNNSTTAAPDAVLYDESCWNDTMAECHAKQDGLCQSLSATACLAESPEYDLCLKLAKDVYRGDHLSSCIEAANKTCVYEQRSACTIPMKQACRDQSDADCSHIEAPTEYYQCYNGIFDPCEAEGRLACTAQAESYCVANMNFEACYINETIQRNVTVDECETVQLDCSTCLFQLFENCTDWGIGKAKVCYDIAAQVSSHKSILKVKTLKATLCCQKAKPGQTAIMLRNTNVTIHHETSVESPLGHFQFMLYLESKSMSQALK